MKTISLHELARQLNPNSFLCCQTYSITKSERPMHKLLEESFPGCVYFNNASWQAGASHAIMNILKKVRRNQTHGMVDSTEEINAYKERQKLIAKWLAQPDRLLVIPE